MFLGLFSINFVTFLLCGFGLFIYLCIENNPNFAYIYGKS